MTLQAVTGAEWAGSDGPAVDQLLVAMGRSKCDSVTTLGSRSVAQLCRLREEGHVCTTSTLLNAVVFSSVSQYECGIVGSVKGRGLQLGGK